MIRSLLLVTALALLNLSKGQCAQHYPLHQMVWVHLHQVAEGRAIGESTTLGSRAAFGISTDLDRWAAEELTKIAHLTAAQFGLVVGGVGESTNSQNQAEEISLFFLVEQETSPEELARLATRIFEAFERQVSEIERLRFHVANWPNLEGVCRLALFTPTRILTYALGESELCEYQPVLSSGTAHIFSFPAVEGFDLSQMVCRPDKEKGEWCHVEQWTDDGGTIVHGVHDTPTSIQTFVHLHNRWYIIRITL